MLFSDEDAAADDCDSYGHFENVLRLFALLDSLWWG
jgi:hypothetical protein